MARYVVVTFHGAGRLAGMLTVSEPFAAVDQAEDLASRLRMALHAAGGTARVVPLTRRSVAGQTGAMGANALQIPGHTR